MATATPEEIIQWRFDWPVRARPDQLPPPPPWLTWLILGGRGAGKTRSGAEWVRALVTAGQAGRIALIGETYEDVREVMIEGESGLMNISPPDMRPAYQSSRHLVTWPNGAVANCFSATDPDGLRGFQFEAAWSDELCKWKYAEEAWSNLQLGLRLGDNPRQLVTTTPRPMALLKRIMKNKNTAVTRASTYANRDNLAPAFLDEIVAIYEGTRLGRQELLGEIVEDIEGALWNWPLIEAARITLAPPLRRIVVAIDPPVTSGPEADECGIVVAGIDESSGLLKRAFLLADLSEGGLTPSQWANKAVKAYHQYDADRIIAEVNQGGEMVTTILRQTDPAIPVRMVRATRGKMMRAEPVAALYETGRIRHVGAFPKLEDQMVSFTGGARTGSPDRLDALVWAITDLMLGPREALPGINWM